MASPSYQKLPLLEDDGNSSNEKALPSLRHTSTSRGPSWIACFLLCFTTAAVTLPIGIMIGTWKYRDLSRTCFEMHSSYSPAIKGIDTSYHNVLFNGSIVMESPFRGALRDELDDAWESLEGALMTTITEEEFAAFPVPVDTIRVPEEVGGGYMGSVEVIHQLHCLNFMRKANVWNYDYYQSRSPEFTDSKETLHHHFDHCADMLRQNLMCNADTTMITYRWVKDRPDPYPNFSNVHKCRNFDSIREWSVQRRMPPLSGRNALHPQPGEQIWDSPP